jgi:hypothetical protein
MAQELAHPTGLSRHSCEAVGRQEITRVSARHVVYPFDPDSILDIKTLAFALQGGLGIETQSPKRYAR